MVTHILYSVVIVVTCYINLSTIGDWIRQSTSNPLLTEGTEYFDLEVKKINVELAKINIIRMIWIAAKSV